VPLVMDARMGIVERADFPVSCYKVNNTHASLILLHGCHCRYDDIDSLEMGEAQADA